MKKHGKGTVQQKWDSLTTRQKHECIKACSSKFKARPDYAMRDYKDLPESVKKGIDKYVHFNIAYNPAKAKRGANVKVDFKILIVDIDERGMYGATLYESDSRDEIWSCDTEMTHELIDDGYLKYKPHEDLDRLRKYLIDNTIIDDGAVITLGGEETEYKKGANVDNQKGNISYTSLDGNEKEFCLSVYRRFIQNRKGLSAGMTPDKSTAKLDDIKESDLKKAINDNMHIFSTEGKALAQSVLAKLNLPY